MDQRERREERERRERAARRARMQEIQRQRQKKAERNIMIAGAVLVLAIILGLVLLVKGCNSKKTANESAPAPSGQLEVVTTADVQENTSEAEEQSSAAGESAENESMSTGAMESTAAGETVTEAESTEEETSQPAETQAQGQIGASTTWDLASLDNTEVHFGYNAENRTADNIPADWQYYENKWGQFNVDWIQDTDSNIIYLTMDEGFPNTTTDTILDTLEAKGVKATFFLTDMYLEGDTSPAQINRMLSLGCVLGNHTSTHPNMPSIGIDAETEEIMTVQNKVKEQYNYDIKLFRFPEGTYSAQSLGLIDNLGLKTVFWTYAYNDFSSTQPEVAPSLQAAIAGLHKGAIFLLHANSTTNAAFLGDWIDAARAAGYEFGVYPLTAN